jgi:hypothetical protein
MRIARLTKFRASVEFPAMKGKRLCSLAAALCLIAGPASAESDGQLWTALFVNGPASEGGRFLLWFDGHARFRDDASDLGVTILRPAVGWRVSDDLSLWTGYARVVARRETGPAFEEHRLWQQATYPVLDALGGRFVGRTRLEQRFPDAGGETGWRLRQFVRFDRRLEGTPLSAIAWNETFVGFNATGWGAVAGYDQSRTFAGAGLHPNKRLRFEVGYMFNHVRRDNAADAANHVALFAIALSL